MNKMREIYVEKVTLNICVGEPGERLENAKKLIERLSGAKAIYTKAKKKIAEFKIRPGLPIGVKVTLRGEKAVEILKRLFKAKDNEIPKEKFDDQGNFAFGIEEYTLIPGMKYDPKIGIIGLDVAVTLARKGYRVRRKRLKSRIGKKHLISKEEAINFIQNTFGVVVK